MAFTVTHHNHRGKTEVFTALDYFGDPANCDQSVFQIHFIDAHFSFHGVLLIYPD
jgi:hypothetical protein